MADANEMYDAIMRELNNVVISEMFETEEEQKGLSFSVETVGIVVFPVIRQVRLAATQIKLVSKTSNHLCYFFCCFMSTLVF